MLYTGTEAVELRDKPHYERKLIERMRELVQSEQDNRALAARYAYDFSEPLCPPNHNIVYVRWAVAIGFTKPEALTQPGQLLYIVRPKGQLLRLGNSQWMMELAQVRRRGLEHFYSVVTMENTPHGSKYRGL